MPDIHKIIEINEERNQEIHGEYNPIVGIGSPIKRVKFFIDEDSYIMLPESMKSIPLIQSILMVGSVERFVVEAMEVSGIKKIKKYVAGIVDEVSTLRLPYDFEFWSATCSSIQNKDGEMVRFKLNYAQRFFLSILEMMRLAGVPIRVILLKARQWGGSTLTQLYMAWIQLFVKSGWNSAIVTSVENQARHIRGMFNRMAADHPPEVYQVKLNPYEGSNKNKVIEGRNAIIGIGSFEEPENLRTFTFQMLHCSEVASWLPTLLKKPENFIQALRAAVPRRPNTLIVLESTAKGIGNFFHKEWKASEGGRSGYKPVFVPWFFIEEYTIPIEDYAAYINKMGNREWELWQEGATLEGINWYMTFKMEEGYDEWQMKEEFPTNAREAFQSSGHRVFPAKDVVEMRKTCIPPEMVGELNGDASKGKESLSNIQFYSDSKGGNFSVWVPPDKSISVSNRYAVFVDIGGTTSRADYSVIRVIDRYWMLEGGKPEMVATWRGHVDHDLLAWKSVQIAKWYNNALLAIEENSLDREDDGYGHFYTLLDQIADSYNNLYSRTNPDKIREGAPVKYGFWTNHQTKNMIIDALKAAIRLGDDGQRGYIEKDDRACDEMDQYENKPGNKLGAVDGAKDDMVITTAGCVWLATEYMDPPRIKKPVEKSRKRNIISEASI